VSWEVATFWVAVLAVVVTVVYGEIERRGQARQRKSDEEQLRLAREQAEMRPDLEVFCAIRRRKSSEKGTLQVEVTNSGKVAAHNVRGWISFHNAAPDKWVVNGYPARYETTNLRASFE